MRVKSFFLSAIFIFSITLLSCTSIDKTAGGFNSIVSPEPKEGKPEITILASTPDSSDFERGVFPSYIREFESKYGVKVKLLAVGGSGYTEEDGEEFRKELTAKLHMEEGPELIYCSGYRFMPLATMVKQKVVMNIKEKLPNINKIYDSLLEEEMYYVPVGMVYGSRTISRHIIEDLGISEPRIDWTIEDYYSIREKWLAKSPRLFTKYELYDAMEKYLENMKLLDEADSRAMVNTQEMAEAVRSCRSEIFSGKYKLNRDYTYINYYNMMFEPESEEYKKDLNLCGSFAYREDSLGEHFGGENLLRPIEVEETLKAGDKLLMPYCRDEDNYLWTNGFMVNCNSGNKELAFEFINSLLSSEVQMEMYRSRGESYPVNKEIETDIRAAEAQASSSKRSEELKEYALGVIKSGNFKLNELTLGTKERWLLETLYRDIFEIMLADKDYNDDELSDKLQVIENKYNIWLNE